MVSGRFLWPAGECDVSRRRLLGLLGTLCAAGALESLSACGAHSANDTNSRSLAGPTTSTVPSATKSAATTTAPPPPDGALDVRRFGARGDGKTDDTKAIVAALAALRPGGTLVFPAGTFRHSDVLAVEVGDVTLQGPGRLLATAEETSALRIDAPAVTVRNITLAIDRTTRRWSSPDQHKLFVAAHRDIQIKDLVVQGSAAAGLFCSGTTNFRITDVKISDTRADGVHMTNGAHHGVVDSPSVQRTGDDGVAVVSYLTDPSPCHDITVNQPRIRTTTGGRGVSVVGGHDIDYVDIDVDRSRAAGVYIACELGYLPTRSVARVTVRGGFVTNANTSPTNDQGAVLVFNGRGGGEVDDVVVEGLTVTGTRLTASRQIGVVVSGAQARVDDIVFRDLQLAAEPTPYQGNAATTGVVLDAVRAAGAAVRTAR